MNDFFKIADKYLKPVTTGAGVVLGLAVTYAAGSYLSGMSKLYGGFYHRLRPHHRVTSSALLAEVKFRLEISSALTAATR